MARKHGKWGTESVFEDIDYGYRDGLFAFHTRYSLTDDPPEEFPMGIYDIYQWKVILEPQFLSVDFLPNGDIKVEVFDRELGRRIEKIIDRSGKERFKSVYSSIDTDKEPYSVSIRDKGDWKYGLIDKDGNVLIPAIYHRIDGWDDPLFTISVDGKAGLVSIGGKQIFPARYEEIRWCQDRKHFFCRTTDGCYEMFLFENK